MSAELEAAALDSAGGWLRWKRKHADIPVGTPCANCETPLQGTYCHTCGQLAEDFHRNSWHLLVEAVESLLHLDGKLFSTLPNLLRRPGKLTRDFLDGKRASQVQPFRMFLVILLVVLFVSHLAQKKTEHGAEEGAHGTTNSAVHVNTPGGDHGAGEAATEPTQNKPTGLLPLPNTPHTRAALDEARAEIAMDPTMTAAEKRTALMAVNGDWAKFGQAVADQKTAEAAADGHMIDTSPNDSARMKAFKHWAEVRIDAIREDPKRFSLIMEIWLHRVAILALPVSALMLSLLFIFNRRFFVFDHLVFSMHSLSFQMLLVTVILLLSMLIGGWAWWLILIMPVHLYLHMKGAYERSAFGTVCRMTALFVMTTFTFSTLALLWLYLAFNEMAGH
ncbi:DUF3667 domain-containing protein [Brevundimonas goettingensis]|uniref:DUF3667 domain-containing protein n=1 Tax=Brevundimonas goettingensis TaxID=2774190 RepID=A0A975GWP4_9CAUL|nr:DUF3667 domain-containing protein [Brevundimonas goettingensis]QTC92078.1 DUF3667 domain-containing protein [Brevundimonas goettingensis]